MDSVIMVVDSGDAARDAALGGQEPAVTAAGAPRVRRFGDVATAMAALEQDGADVVILGLSLDEPVRTTQRAFARQPDVAVLLVVEESEREALEYALRFAPLVGDVSCHLSAAVAAQVPAAIERTRIRRRNRAEHDALRLRLHEPPTPPPEQQPTYYLGRFFDGAPIGIVVASGDGTVLTMNQTAATLLGRRERELLGRSLLPHFPKVAQADLRARLLAVTGPAAVSAQLMVSRPLATGPQVLEVSISPIRIGAAEAGAQLILHDVTARAAAEAARDHAAREALRLRDEFLGIASHELRTPLTPLKLQLQGLQRRLRADTAIGQPVAEQLDVALRQTERLARLVDQLLDVSRIRGGSLDLHLREVDLSQVARAAAARVMGDATLRGVTVNVHAKERVVGLWDQARVEQVVGNLLANAVKYGAGRPVEIAVAAEGDRALLTVRDEGIGIAAADQARVFGRFERAVSPRRYGGLGLGLWIVRQVVAALGGQVTVQSEIGHGATFTVTLPLAPGA